MSKKSLLVISDKRKQLLAAYKSSSEDGFWDKDSCPFCGIKNDNLMELFESTSKVLEANTDHLQMDLRKSEEALQQLFAEKVIPVAKTFIDENIKLTCQSDILSPFCTIDVSKLHANLVSHNITEFSCTSDNVDMTSFNNDYEAFRNRISKMIRSVERVLTEQDVETYRNIYTTYYHGNSITHTINDIESKIAYIAAQYSNFYSLRIVELEKKQKALSQTLLVLDQSSQEIKGNISDLIARYEKAYKQYQSEIVNSIKLPFFIFSGRIIQNYPMGLGINIEINDTQIVFQAGDKPCDVFNILSLGQLNGVILAVLLSIKSVFGKREGLDLLLIDDPLQSIDDISAYSFADLLSEQFSNTQVILSTHEDDKAHLFQYKSTQAGLLAKAHNMQDAYLGINNN